jgi:hypothetical protein
VGNPLRRSPKLRCRWDDEEEWEEGGREGGRIRSLKERLLLLLLLRWDELD